MAIVDFSAVTMQYGRGPAALTDVSFAVRASAFTLLLGPSGAGKSTLLKLVLAMERPQAGTIRVAGRDIHRLRRASIPYLRRNVGAVFQDFKLLPEATPLENVALALRVLGASSREIEARAGHALERVELDPKIRRPSRCLSGGEQQRVAIARALAGDPAILLADEPTGNLDPSTSLGIMRLLDRINRTGTTVVMATHDDEIVDQMRKRVIELAGGRLVRDQDRGVYGSAR